MHGESWVDALGLKWRLPIVLVHIGLGAARGNWRNCQHRHSSTLKHVECTGRPMTIGFLFRLINGSTCTYRSTARMCCIGVRRLEVQALVQAPTTRPRGE